MQLETYHPFEAADRVIDRLDEWLEEIGEWFYMDDLGIPNDPAKFRQMAESAIRMYGGKEEMVGGIKPLSVDDIVAIYMNCVRPGVPESVEAAKKKSPVESPEDGQDKDSEAEEPHDELIPEGENEVIAVFDRLEEEGSGS